MLLERREALIPTFRVTDHASHDGLLSGINLDDSVIPAPHPAPSPLVLPRPPLPSFAAPKPPIAPFPPATTTAGSNSFPCLPVVPPLPTSQAPKPPPFVFNTDKNKPSLPSVAPPTYNRPVAPPTYDRPVAPPTYDRPASLSKPALPPVPVNHHARRASSPPLPMPSSPASSKAVRTRQDDERRTRHDSPPMKGMGEELQASTRTSHDSVTPQPKNKGPEIDPNWENDVNDRVSHNPRVNKRENELDNSKYDLLIQLGFKELLPIHKYEPDSCAEGCNLDSDPLVSQQAFADDRMSHLAHHRMLVRDVTRPSSTPLTDAWSDGSSPASVSDPQWGRRRQCRQYITAAQAGDEARGANQKNTPRQGSSALSTSGNERHSRYTREDKHVELDPSAAAELGQEPGSGQGMQERLSHASEKLPAIQAQVEFMQAFLRLCLSLPPASRGELANDLVRGEGQTTAQPFDFPQGQEQAMALARQFIMHACTVFKHRDGNHELGSGEKAKDVWINPKIWFDVLSDPVLDSAPPLLALLHRLVPTSSNEKVETCSAGPVGTAGHPDAAQPIENINSGLAKVEGRVTLSDVLCGLVTCVIGPALSLSLQDKAALCFLALTTSCSRLPCLSSSPLRHARAERGLGDRSAYEAKYADCVGLLDMGQLARFVSGALRKERAAVSPVTVELVVQRMKAQVESHRKATQAWLTHWQQMQQVEAAPGERTGHAGGSSSRSKHKHRKRRQHARHGVSPGSSPQQENKRNHRIVSPRSNNPLQPLQLAFPSPSFRANSRQHKISSAGPVPTVKETRLVQEAHLASLAGPSDSSSSLSESLLSSSPSDVSSIAPPDGQFLPVPQLGKLACPTSSPEEFLISETEFVGLLARDLPRIGRSLLTAFSAVSEARSRATQPASGSSAGTNKQHGTTVLRGSVLRWLKAAHPVLRRPAFFLLYHLGLVASFAYKFYRYSPLGSRSEVFGLMSFGICIARGSAQAILYLSTFCLLFCSPTLLTWLHGWPALAGILPLDQAQLWHRWSATYFLLFSLFHCAGHVEDVRRILSAPVEQVTAVLGPGLWDGQETGRPPQFQQLLLLLPIWTGVLLVVLFGLGALLLLLFDPTKQFRSWWKAHYCFELGSLVLLFHGWKGLLEPPQALYFMLPPLCLHLLPYLPLLCPSKLCWPFARCYGRGPNHSRILSLHTIGPPGAELIHMRLERPSNWSPQAGQFARVNIPALSRNEWHSFTIAYSSTQPVAESALGMPAYSSALAACSCAGAVSSSEVAKDTAMDFLIYPRGPWTKKLLALAKARPAASSTSIATTQESSLNSLPSPSTNESFCSSTGQPTPPSSNDAKGTAMPGFFFPRQSAPALVNVGPAYAQAHLAPAGSPGGAAKSSVTPSVVAHRRLNRAFTSPPAFPSPTEQPLGNGVHHNLLSSHMQKSQTRSSHPGVQSIQNVWAAKKACASWPSIKLMGPFGAAYQCWHQYPVLLLVATGVGVTPVLCILRQLLSRKQYSQLYTKRVYVLWVVRSEDNFSWLDRTLANVLALDHRGIVCIEQFVTRTPAISAKPLDARAVAAWSSSPTAPPGPFRSLRARGPASPRRRLQESSRYRRLLHADASSEEARARRRHQQQLQQALQLGFLTLPPSALPLPPPTSPPTSPVKSELPPSQSLSSTWLPSSSPASRALSPTALTSISTLFPPTDTSLAAELSREAIQSLHDQRKDFLLQHVAQPPRRVVLGQRPDMRSWLQRVVASLEVCAIIPAEPALLPSKRQQMKVGVFFCGSNSLGKALDRAVNQRNANTRDQRLLFKLRSSTYGSVI
eukprot:g4124.t1